MTFPAFRDSFLTKSERLYLLFETKPKLTLVVILLLGACYRLYQLQFQSLWLEELYSIVVSNPEKELSTLLAYCKTNQPPFYPIVLRNLFDLTGYNEFNGRLFSVIFGVLGIGAVYFVGKETISEKAGLFASLITAINHFHVSCSQELRFYSLMFLLAALSYLFFVRALKNGSWKNLLFYSVFSLCLLYTHFYGVLILAIQTLTVGSLALFKTEYRNGKFILSWLGMFASLMALLVPWMSSVTGSLAIPAYWTPEHHPIFFLAIHFQYFNNALIIVYIILFLLFFPFFLYSLAKEKLLSSITEANFLVLSLWLILGLAIPYVYSVFKAPVVYTRFTMVVLPAVFLIAAIGFHNITRVGLRMTVVVVLTISAAVDFKTSGYYSDLRYPQIREASSFLTKNHDGSRIFSEYSEWFNYYFYKTDPKIRIEDVKGTDFRKEIADQQHIWLIGMYGKALNDEDQKAVDNLFSVVKTHKFWNTYVVFLKRRPSPTAHK